jgi:hypothetical protein
LINNELPAIAGTSFLVDEIRRCICAFLIKLDLENSKAVIPKRNIDQIPKSDFESILTNKRKLRNPKRVLENL